MNSHTRKAMIFFLLLSLFTSSFALTVPEGLADNISKSVRLGWKVTVGETGWSEIYNLPQKEYSADSFKDNYVDFGETGLFAIASHVLNDSEILSDLNSGETISEKMQAISSNILKWQWTPAGTGWGAADLGQFPSEKRTHVTDQLQGVYGPNSECKDVTISFNQWAFPKDTVTTEAETEAMQLEGAIIALLKAREFSTNPTEQEQLKTAAMHAGDALLSVIVTDNSESFGIHQSDLTDKFGFSAPVGLIGHRMDYDFDKNDSKACSDAGTIRVNETFKRELIFGAIAYQNLYDVTQDSKYKTASDNALKLLFNERECDGTFKMYTRWEGSGSSVNIECIDDQDGSTSHPYEQNVVVSSETNVLYDTTYILFLTQQLSDQSYNRNPEFKESVQWLLQVEEEDTIGVGARKNNADRIYASQYQDLKLRGFVQSLLGDIFLRSSCIETDSAMKERLENKGTALLEKGLSYVNIVLDVKPAYAPETDIGKSTLGLAALADGWKIMTEGCKKCSDIDGDGFKDASCTEKPTVDDCDDSSASIHPGASETCNNVDDDCDGQVDDGFDQDQDGSAVCENDCDDGNPNRSPDKQEVEDDIDNNCNEKIDEASFSVQASDGNAGIEGVEANFFKSESVCLKSFKLEDKFFSQILDGCNNEGTCTTGANGTCTMQLDKGGVYTVIGKKGKQFFLAENQQLTVGEESKPMPLLIQSESQTGSGVSDNPFLKDNFPFIIGGAILLVIIVIGVFVFKIQKPGSGFKPAPKVKTEAKKHPTFGMKK